MSAVFADTFYYIALLSKADQWHQKVIEFTGDFAGRMLTTGWVLTELADGMAALNHRQILASFLNALQADPQVTIIPPDSSHYEEGIKLYSSRPDKEWSLTDCISFVVMQQEGLTEALTGDRHFEQAGFVALLK